MSEFPWPQCPNRHDLTNPDSLYINTRTGRRHCRQCRADSNRRTRANRIHAIPTITKRSRRKSYANWARATWENMSEHDRFLVRSALLNMELPE